MDSMRRVVIVFGGLYDTSVAIKCKVKNMLISWRSKFAHKKKALTNIQLVYR